MATLSTIGPTTSVRGNVHGEGDLEVFGHVEGSIVVDGDVTIGEGALIRSDVRGRNVTVRGAVAGNISGEGSIVLEAGARVVGDLGAPQIGIRPGALVRGQVTTGAPPSAGTAPQRTQVAVTPKQAPAAHSRQVEVRAPSTAARPPARAPAAARPAAPAQRAAPAAAEQSPAAAEPRAPAEARHGPAATEARHAPAAAEARHAPAAEPKQHAARASATTPQAQAARPEEERWEIVPEAGPPPPVVPAIRKGTRASLRKKSGQ